MRTVIFLGLLAIADSIGTDYEKDNVASFLYIAFLVFAIMDLLEFFKPPFDKTKKQ